MRKLLTGAGVAFAVGYTALLGASGASAAPEKPAMSPELVAAMTSEGCNEGYPPGDMQHWETYDGYLWWSPCEECDNEADNLAMYGYRTWCWETIPNEQAMLWVGPLGGGGGAGADMRPISAEELAKLKNELSR